MISGQLGAGYAIVALAPDNNPNSGGGPINRAPGSNVVRAHAGNMVYRSPTANVYEPEAGSRWPGDLSKMMFLPDGRLVKANDSVIDMFHGAGGPEPVVMVSGGGAAAALRSLIPAAAMFSGGYVGYRSAERHKVWGTIGGAIAGGILGLIFR